MHVVGTLSDNECSTVASTPSYFQSTCWLQLAISGMTCGSCSVAIQSALVKLPGVTVASVGLLSNSAEVRSPLDVHAHASIEPYE
jgi:hypothetical protein